MELRPICLKDANAFVLSQHRHHLAVRGHKFSLACWVAEVLHGVAIVGRPVSRELDDGLTLEVLRLCTDGEKNACSFLYAASARAGRALGYKRIITYILESESGVSLTASGWTYDSMTQGGRSWNTPKRRRALIQFDLFGAVEKYPIVKKKRFIKKL